MLEVTFTTNGKRIAVIEIERFNTSTQDEMDHPGDFGDYDVKYLIERGDASGMHLRRIYSFPRKHYNVFALTLQALEALNKKDLELEADYDIDSEDEATVSTDMARGFRTALRAIQGRLR